MPLGETLEHGQRPIFLLLGDVVPESILHDANKNRPYPPPGARRSKCGACEVSDVCLAMFNPTCANGLPIEVFQPLGFSQVFGLDVSKCWRS